MKYFFPDSFSLPALRASPEKARRTLLPPILATIVSIRLAYLPITSPPRRQQTVTPIATSQSLSPRGPSPITGAIPEPVSCHNNHPSLGNIMADSGGTANKPSSSVKLVLLGEAAVGKVGFLLASRSQTPKR